jgi:hypothetical protein
MCHAFSPRAVLLLTLLVATSGALWIFAAVGKAADSDHRPANVLTQHREEATAVDTVPAEVVQRLSSPASGISYRWGTSRHLTTGVDDAFYTVTNKADEICLVAIAPRSEYQGSLPSNQIAVSCRSVGEFERLGIVMILGPNDAQRGIVLMPDQLSGIAILDGMSGTPTSIQFVNNALRISLHTAADAGERESQVVQPTLLRLQGPAGYLTLALPPGATIESAE